MANQVVDNKKFTWVIRNFSSLESHFIDSDEFVVDGCKWRLKAYPKGLKNPNYMPLFLYSAQSDSLPCGWRRHTKFSITIVNHIKVKLSIKRETQQWFSEKNLNWGFKSMYALQAEHNGFVVNGELKIVVEIDVLEVIGLLDVPRETSLVMESMDVLPSQFDSAESSMGNQVVNDKYTWVIKSFSSLPSDRIYSDIFVIGGCKWRLMAYPKGRKNNDHFSLYLDVAESTSLPSGWRRHVKFSLTVINRNSEKFSKLQDLNKWFSEKDTDWGFISMFPLTELKAKNSGFLVNGDLKIVAEVNVLEVIGKSDVVEVIGKSDEAKESSSVIESIGKVDEPKETSSVMESMGKVDEPKETSSVMESISKADEQKEASSVMESVDVNGFHVLPSQVESVRRIFEKQPDIALNFRKKNQLLRTACMNILLSLTGTLRQPLQELVHDDLVEAESALIYVKDSGFKVDWLEKKLKEVKAKKKEEQICESRVQELDKELKDCKRKWSDIEAQLEKEKAKLLASRAHLTLDDFF